MELQKCQEALIHTNISKVLKKPLTTNRYKIQHNSNNDFINFHFAKSTPALAFNLRTRDSNWFHVSELEEDELDLDRPYGSLTRFDFSREARIGGSANGLLFLYNLSRGNNTLYVCNPITREFCLLRCPRAITHGFGVSRISGQYKVVSVDPQAFYGQNQRRFVCYVYTLGTGSWRLVEATDSFDWSLVVVGAFAHGNLHWMVSSNLDFMERISCFDLETECFCSFTVPPLHKRKMCRHLYALRDSIGFCDESPDGGGIAIWMMKEYGDENSWTMEYVINLNLDITLPRGVDPFDGVSPIKIFENGDVLMVAAGKRFMYYSNKAKTVREIGGFFGGGEEFIYMNGLLVTPSMVSLRCFSDVENVISF